MPAIEYSVCVCVCGRVYTSVAHMTPRSELNNNNNKSARLLELYSSNCGRAWRGRRRRCRNKPRTEQQARQWPIVRDFEQPLEYRNNSWNSWACVSAPTTSIYGICQAGTATRANRNMCSLRCRPEPAHVAWCRSRRRSRRNPRLFLFPYAFLLWL